MKNFPFQESFLTFNLLDSTIFSPVGAGIFDAFTVMSLMDKVDSFNSPSALV